MVKGQRAMVMDQLASVLGQVASQTRHKGASDARRTPCTLSVAGDRVTWRCEPQPKARRAHQRYGERERAMAKQIGPVPRGRLLGARGSGWYNRLPRAEGSTWAPD